MTPPQCLTFSGQGFIIKLEAIKDIGSSSGCNRKQTNLFQRFTRDEDYPLLAVGNSLFSIFCGDYLCRTMPQI